MTFYVLPGAKSPLPQKEKRPPFMLKFVGFWFRVPMSVRLLGGFLLGTFAGLAGNIYAREQTLRAAETLEPFGTIMIAMLKMVVVPIIFFSLIAGAAALPLKKSGRVGTIVVLWYLVTSVFAAVFGISMAMLVNPTISVESMDIKNPAPMTGGAVPSLARFLEGLFCNPFEALSSGNFLAIVIFAVIFGLAARVLLDSEKSAEKTAKAIETFLSCVHACGSVTFKLIDWIMEYFPFGIFILTFVNFARSGAILFEPYLNVILSVTIGLLAMIFLIYPLLLFCVCRENPYRVLAKFREPMFTAFTTRSSFATLPVSIKTLNKIGVSPVLTSFSLPLGCTVNMDGACVLLPAYAILAANAFDITITAANLAIILVTVLFASIGAGGIPNGSLFLLFIILKNIGLHDDQVSFVVALAFGIDPLIDMVRTTCNCTGDMVCTYAIAKRVGMFRPPEG